MEIFAVWEYSEEPDSDHYYYNLDKSIVSYHKTEAGAQAFVEEKLEQREPLNGIAWDAKLGDGRNLELMELGCNGEDKRVHIVYEVSSIELGD